MADGGAAAASDRRGYVVRVARSWEEGERAFAAALSLGAATPFQDIEVVASWYRAMARRADIEPLVVSVREKASGVGVLDLALVRQRRGVVRTIGFADLHLIDYNAPVLGPGAPTDAGAARAVWRAIRRALPPADLIDLRKMPLRVGERSNPLALLSTLPCALNGNTLRLGESYEDYMQGLRRVVRKEIERSWRVFTRHPGASFRIATDPGDRRRILSAIEAQQPIRMGRVGKAYHLDAPEAADFYRRLLESDPNGTRVVLLALSCGDEIVAALMGLRQAAGFTMIRISSSVEDAWSNCSPGRLVIERAMAHLHAEGVRDVDFSVGNSDVKRRFGVLPIPLVDLVRAETPLGLVGAARAHALAWLGGHPDLEASLRRRLGRIPAVPSA